MLDVTTHRVDDAADETGEREEVLDAEEVGVGVADHVAQLRLVDGVGDAHRDDAHHLVLQRVNLRMVTSHNYANH